jgi:hypothetical protein
MLRLRDEKCGNDSRTLDAYFVDNGALRIEGQDLGPGTAPVSDDGEYEWSYTYGAEVIPALVAALGGEVGENILELLARKYVGTAGSYELERVLRATGDTIPHAFSCWS